jgi:hypothetical protein
MRVIVCGGRDFPAGAEQRSWMYGELSRLHAERPVTYLFHGNASGADRAAAAWASLHRDHANIKVFAVPAEWSKHGRAAGPKRNQAMLGQGIDRVVAFPGGKGTADMVARARRAGVEVLEVAP